MKMIASHYLAKLYITMDVATGTQLQHFKFAPNKLMKQYLYYSRTNRDH